MQSKKASRVIMLADYMVKHGSTVRETAKVFGISKSTVHKDVTELLPEINGELHGKVRSLLQKNKAERHIRGGNATRLKFLNKLKEDEH